jgi:hypothetical protein
MTSPEKAVNGGSAPSREGGDDGKRVRSAPHPRYSLRQVEELARKALELGARNCDQDTVARAFSYKNSTNGSFKGLRAAGLYFGIIEYKDEHFLSVAEPWIEALHREDPEELRSLRQKAMLRPSLYKQLFEDFNERQLGTPEKLAQRLFLQPKFNILKDAADTAARTFLESASYAGLIDANGFLRMGGAKEDRGGDAGNAVTPVDSTGTPSTLTPPQKVMNPTPTPAQSQQIGGGAFAAPEGLDRIEVLLRSGKRAYLFVPVPLPRREKERLKQYIDLILEDDPEEMPPPAPRIQAREGGE